MKKILCLLSVLIVLTACGSKPAPEWIGASYNHLEGFKKHYLRGNERLAEKSFQRALEEVKSSGDLEAMAIVHLTKLAVLTAVLEKFEDREYLHLAAADSALPHFHYYSFLKGSLEGVDTDQLPAQYRHFLKALRKGSPSEIQREASRIDDPLSRMIAIGLVVRGGQENELLLNGAIETASRQGWKRPLLAYLKRIERYYDSTKEMNKAADVRKRLELISP